MQQNTPTFHLDIILPQKNPRKDYGADITQELLEEEAQDLVNNNPPLGQKREIKEKKDQ